MSQKSNLSSHSQSPDDITVAYAVYPTAPPLRTPLGDRQPSVLGFQNEGGAREYMNMQGFPVGLQNTFIASLTKFPMRYFILDDSGSMASMDGQRVVTQSGRKTMVSCSRWTELSETMKFHVHLAKYAKAPTEFRFLNAASSVRIGYDDETDSENFSIMLSLLEDMAGGGTPLCRHIRDVIQSIELIADELRSKGQKACIVIATDGESSDGDIAKAMIPLKDLPVWVVVRLCTNEDKIVNYWHNIDQQLELNMEVIDDFCGEASEVYGYNPWLTYGEPLQRLREFGCHVKELDHLDESKLTKEQFLKVCQVIFGGSINDYPNPDIDTPGLLAKIDKCNMSVGKVWSPISHNEQFWINGHKALSMYGKSKKGCTIS